MALIAVQGAQAPKPCPPSFPDAAAPLQKPPAVGLFLRHPNSFSPREEPWGRESLSSILPLPCVRSVTPGKSLYSPETQILL